MHLKELQAAVMACALVVARQACGSIGFDSISSLDTGVSTVNVGGVVVDANWTVCLLSGGTVNPAVAMLNGTAQGGAPSGGASMGPNNIGFPFGYWIPNTTTSSWLTYTTPTPVGGDMTGGTYQYQVTFTAANSGVVDVSWLSDNGSWLYVNGNLIGSKGSVTDSGSDFSPFNLWNQGLSFGVTKGTLYTVDLDVFNAPQGYGNPTGGRVEFTSGGVQFNSLSAVPEPTTLISGALMLLPFGTSALRILRRNRAVWFLIPIEPNMINVPIVCKDVPKWDCADVGSVV
jgi:hypothetical protein